MIHAGRRAALHGHAVETLSHLAGTEIDMPDMAERDAFPDERLKLMFVCAHPAIDPVARTPLMLQAVLGLDAVRIASAFLVSPATMSQRLVRAKARSVMPASRFPCPAATNSPKARRRAGRDLRRLWQRMGRCGRRRPETQGPGPGGDRSRPRARGLAPALSRNPLGLLALMLYCEARQAARRDREGRFVPLSEQDVTLWNGEMIDEAELPPLPRGGDGPAGPFQTEAAIQSVHARRGITGATELSRPLAMLLRRAGGDVRPPSACS